MPAGGRVTHSRTARRPARRTFQQGAPGRGPAWGHRRRTNGFGLVQRPRGPRAGAAAASAPNRRVSRAGYGSSPSYDPTLWTPPSVVARVAPSRGEQAVGGAEGLRATGGGTVRTRSGTAASSGSLVVRRARCLILLRFFVAICLLLGRDAVVERMLERGPRLMLGQCS